MLLPCWKLIFLNSTNFDWKPRKSQFRNIANSSINSAYYERYSALENIIEFFSFQENHPENAGFNKYNGLPFSPEELGESLAKLVFEVKI